MLVPSPSQNPAPSPLAQPSDFGVPCTLSQTGKLAKTATNSAL